MYKGFFHLIFYSMFIKDFFTYFFTQHTLRIFSLNFVLNIHEGFFHLMFYSTWWRIHEGFFLVLQVRLQARVRGRSVVSSRISGRGRAITPWNTSKVDRNLVGRPRPWCNFCTFHRQIWKSVYGSNTWGFVNCGTPTAGMGCRKSRNGLKYY